MKSKRFDLNNNLLCKLQAIFLLRDALEQFPYQLLKRNLVGKL